jgi:hypothetical protein
MGWGLGVQISINSEIVGWGAGEGVPFGALKEDWCLGGWGFGARGGRESVRGDGGTFCIN